MDKKKKLTGREREFFSLVTRAVFANPFSDDRKQFDLEISGLPPGTPSDKAQAGVIQTVDREIAAFEGEGKASVIFFQGMTMNWSKTRCSFMYTINMQMHLIG